MGSRACLDESASASARTAPLPLSVTKLLSPMAEQTPFLPFIEVVRGSFASTRAS